jgi:dUTP pyrophosphatase
LIIETEKLHLNAKIPAPGTVHAAGYDLHACIDACDITIPPGGRGLVPTGLAFAIPVGWCGEILPRSGMALRDGVTVLNAPGLIDADYRGEVCVILVNHGSEPFDVPHGARIAQIKFSRCEPVIFKRAILDDTARGRGGFGSTGP